MIGAPRRAIVGTVVALLLLAVAFVQAQSPEDRAQWIGLGEGYRIPDFAAKDLSGREHTLQGYAGQVLVLHFWATWCPYCRGEIDELVKLQRDWAAKGVRILAISTDEDPERLKRFISEAALPYPIVADMQGTHSVAEQFAVSGIPLTFVVSRDGRVASRLEGASEIIEAVQDALAQVTPAS